MKKSSNKVSVADLPQRIMEWFEKENKPVTPQSLTNALGSVFPKAAVQKCLEQLFLEGGKLNVKEIKKVKIYYLKVPTEGEQEPENLGGIHTTDTSSGQCTDPLNEDDNTTGETAAEDEVDWSDPTEKQRFIQQLLQLHQQIEHEGIQQRCLAAIPDAKQRADRLQFVTKGIEQLEAVEAEIALEAIRKEEEEAREAVKNGGEDDDETVVDPSLSERLIAKYRAARGLWSQRKQLAMTIFDDVATSYPPSVPLCDVYDALGVVTDDMCGVTLKSSAVPALSFGGGGAAMATSRALGNTA